MSPFFTGISKGLGGTGFGRSAAATTAARTADMMPILVTDSTGTTATGGVNSDSFASSLQFAIPGATSSGLNLTDQNPTGRVSALRNLTNNGSLSANTGIYKYYGGSLLTSNGATGSFSTDVWNSIGSGQFTIEMWVYTTGTSQTAGYGCTIISSRGPGDNSNGFFSLGFTGDNPGPTPRLFITISGGFTHYISDDGTSQTFPANTWTHIACTKDSSNTVRTYRNGIKIKETTNMTQSLNNVNRGLWGGQDYGAFASYVDFYVNDVRVYNTAKYTGNSFSLF